MRTKSLTALALCALALVGCSSSPAESEPSIPADQPASITQPSASAAPSSDPEEAFIESVESRIADAEDSFEDAMPAEKLTEAYWLERGEVYCEKAAQGGTEMPRLKNVTENQFEIVLMGSAVSSLCPVN